MGSDAAASRTSARPHDALFHPRRLTLVGMGLMRHFRMQFDFRERSLGIVPGPSYLALERTGIEVVDASGAAQIVAVAPGSPASRARGAVPIVLSRRGLRVRRTLTLHGLE
jgi:hypothetical protein